MRFGPRPARLRRVRCEICGRRGSRSGQHSTCYGPRQIVPLIPPAFVEDILDLLFPVMLSLSRLGRGVGSDP